MRSGPSVGLPSACTRMSTTCISKALEHVESDGRELLRHIKYNMFVFMARARNRSFVTLLLALASSWDNVAGHGQQVAWNPPPVPDSVVAHDVPYTLEGQSFTGYVAFPKDPTRTASAGVFVGHTWNGISSMEKWRSQQLAAKGFVAFVPDLYGTNVRPKTDAAARAEMDKILSNLTAFYYHLNEGVDILKSGLGPTAPKVNSSELFAVGYCLGGQMVLELARRGYDFKGVTSFHGELGNLTSKSNDKFTPSVAISVHHADLDYQGPQALLDIENELRANNVSRWMTHKYGHCHHAWTVPSNANYKPFEAAQSHDYMFSFNAAILEASRSGA